MASKKNPWLYVVSFHGSDVAAYTSALECVALWRHAFNRDAFNVKVRRYRISVPGSIQLECDDVTEIVRKAL